MNALAANLALNKPAVQSSTAPGFVASRVNDGSLVTVSCTKYSAHSWWAVDLQVWAQVDRVTVTNDRLYGTVIIANSLYSLIIIIINNIIYIRPMIR